MSTEPVLLLFCDSDKGGWLRWLRPGFRHVFAALPAASGWIILDPLSNRLEVTCHPAVPAAVLARWFRRHGVTALTTQRHAPPPRPARPEPLTCVSLAKRLLGLDAPFILTPWQLYRHLGGPCPSHRGGPTLSRLFTAPKPAIAASPPPPAPSLPAAPAPLVATPAPPAPDTDIPATAAERNLLRRAEGRAGTVLTGWRGLLAPGSLAPRRKSLLGE